MKMRLRFSMITAAAFALACFSDTAHAQRNPSQEVMAAAIRHVEPLPDSGDLHIVSSDRTARDLASVATRIGALIAPPSIFDCDASACRKTVEGSIVSIREAPTITDGTAVVGIGVYSAPYDSRGRITVTIHTLELKEQDGQWVVTRVIGKEYAILGGK